MVSQLQRVNIATVNTAKKFLKCSVCLSRNLLILSFSNFNHPSEDYVNYISIDLSAQMISTQNDCQNRSR